MLADGAIRREPHVVHAEILPGATAVLTLSGDEMPHSDAELVCGEWYGPLAPPEWE